MKTDACFLWEGRMYEAAKFERTWRQRTALYARYNGKTICLNRFLNSGEAREALFILQEKIGNSNGNRSAQTAQPS